MQVVPCGDRAAEAWHTRRRVNQGWDRPGLGLTFEVWVRVAAGLELGLRIE